MCVSRVLECIEPLYMVLVCSIELLIFISLLKLIVFFTRHDVIEVINKTAFQYSDNQKVYDSSRQGVSLCEHTLFSSA